MCFGGRPIYADLMGVLGREQDEIYTDSPLYMQSVEKRNDGKSIFTGRRGYPVHVQKPNCQTQSASFNQIRQRYIGYGMWATTQKSASH